MTMPGAGDNTTVQTGQNPDARMPLSRAAEVPPRNFVESPDYGRPGYGGFMRPAGFAKNTVTAFEIFERNPARRYLVIQNLSTTAVLWIRPSESGKDFERANVGTPSIALNPAPAAGQGGGVFVMEGEAISLDAWTGIFSADDASSSFAAYEI